MKRAGIVLALVALYLVGGFAATAIVGHVWGAHAGAEVMAFNALVVPVLALVALLARKVLA